MIYTADYANLVSAVLVSSDTYVREHPHETKAFVRAFLAGLQDVIDDPEWAFEVSEDYVEGLEDNRATQWPVLQTSIERLWETPTLGLMDLQSWEQAQQVMLDTGLIEQTVPVETLFTNTFVLDTE